MTTYSNNARPLTGTGSQYSPQADRFQLLECAVTFGLLCLLMFYMSVYVPMLEPKFGFALAAFCLFINGKKSFEGTLPLILGIIGYGIFVGIIFPAPKPNIGLILQRSLFFTDCVLLAVAGLSGQSLKRQYFLFIGILAISVVGMIGDLKGHDMTAFLPFEMPNEVYFDHVAMDPSGIARVRGFFPESGVLGAASLGISTCAGLGALVLIFARVQARAALTALFSVLVLGGSILCLTVTKSGMAMVAAGMTGFLSKLLFSRDKACRAASGAALLLAVAGGPVFILVAPGELGSYLRGEILSIVNLHGSGGSGGHYGMLTRIQCWKAAIYSIRYYPFGVGPWGLGSVLDKPTSVQLTQEMQLFFSQDIYGLKNALANLMAETGIVGLGLLAAWLWRGFWVPAQEHSESGTRVGILIAGLYSASAFLSLALLISCELYPCLAMLVVFKFHADAIAETCCPNDQPTSEPTA